MQTVFLDSLQICNFWSLMSVAIIPLRKLFLKAILVASFKKISYAVNCFFYKRSSHLVHIAVIYSRYAAPCDEMSRFIHYTSQGRTIRETGFIQREYGADGDSGHIEHHWCNI